MGCKLLSRNLVLVLRQNQLTPSYLSHMQIYATKSDIEFGLEFLPPRQRA
jgi:hypothetical protein